ncbi:hypothetical protein E2P81_ATG02784 [Venturia nashicola]|uniref:Uncharacterized protein n=1 Tax=Venturia nashicola TaxID=86259 RepID=A0A4Z1P987_9PEZI|nr:hypothetical protein E6O75_ATG02843 [Venturia nashicola]TLD37002.1 hypothetical protein E2P81_ATG02784 [Venturia nashicola]
MRAAEDKLDELWRAIDEESIGKNAYSTRYTQFFARWTLRRTAAWVEPSKTKPPPPMTVDEPTFGLQFRSDPSSECSQPTKNAKPKTHGIARPAPPPEHPADSIVPEDSVR